jgi:hypothetical protein
MTVYTNIKRPVFKGLNTIWSLLTEESRPPEESASSHFFILIKFFAMKILKLGVIKGYFMI